MIKDAGSTDEDMELAAIADSSNEAIVSVNREGIITRWNLMAEKSFGYTKAEAIGKNINLILPLDKQEEEETIRQRVSQGETIQHLETARLTKAGRRIPFSLSVFPVTNHHKEVVATLRIGNDLTQQKKVEERNAILAAIVSSSDDAIISKNLRGYITSWNRAAEEIFNYKEAEMLGKHITIIIPPDRQHEEDMILSKVGSGEKIEHYETIRQRKDGKQVHVSLTISPVRNANNDIIGISKIARNITDQKAANEKAARLAAIVDSSDDAIVSKNLNGIITSWNKSAERIFGYTEQEAIGKHITLIIPQRLRAEEDMIIGQVKSGNRVEHFETKRVRKDGTEIDLSITVSPIKSEKGEIIGASKVARDITETVRAREQLQNYTEELKKINKYKDDFLSLASHELNTPLTSLNVYLQMLEQSLKDELKSQSFLHNYAEKAISLNGKLAKLVKELLDVSRIEAGKLPMQKNDFDCLQLVQETIDNMKVTSKKHQILYEGITGKLVINGDRDRLEQAITNLISNAIKYSPNANKIYVRTKADNHYLYISIHDFGIGIPANVERNIFSRFYRVEGVAQTFSGLGIGLYVSREIVLSHGGDLTYTSEEGKGSVFTIAIPLSK